MAILEHTRRSYNDSKTEQVRVRVRGVSVVYGDTTILSDCNCRIKGPGLCSIVGANGVGKTTLLKLICGIALPTRGVVRVDGKSTARQWKEIRRKIGSSIYPERSYHFRLTGLENLVYFGRLSGFTKKETMRRAIQIQNEFNLAPLLQRNFASLSLGQRKIFGMLVAFVLSEDLVALDEPTATLDSHNAAAVVSMIEWAIKKGMTVITTTHDSMVIDKSDQVIQL